MSGDGSNTGPDPAGAAPAGSTPPPWPDVSRPSRGFRSGGPLLRVVPVVVGLLILVLVVVAGAGYVRGEQDRDRLRQQLAQSDSEAAAKQRELTDRLRRAEEERDAARRDLGGAQGQADELKRQKVVISRCLTLLGEASQAGAAGDEATATARLSAAKPVCDEALRYLD